MSPAANPVEVARAAAASVRDPEIRVLTVAELGILRDVSVDDGDRVLVTVTPTYVACPAMDAIRTDIAAAVRAAGFGSVEVVTSWSPPWSTDWIGEPARAKLRAAGIAPPVSSPVPPPPPGRLLPLSIVRGTPPCPRCGARDTTELGRFGSTACKALWRCEQCREPFDHLKEH